jgi:hypothetical protein
MKNSVKATDMNEEGFQYLLPKSQWISGGRIKVGILIGPQTKEVTNDRNFDKVIEGMGRHGGELSDRLLTVFWADTKHNCKQLVEDML